MIVAEWACSAYGWTMDYVLHGIPAATLALLQRQNRAAAGIDDTMPLSDEEAIRNGTLHNLLKPDGRLEGHN